MLAAVMAVVIACALLRSEGFLLVRPIQKAVATKSASPLREQPLG